MAGDLKREVSGKSIAALIAIYLVYGLAQASNEFRMLFLKDWGLTATECGRVLSAASLLCVFAGPVASALADKLRSRRIVYMISASLWLISVAGLLLFGRYHIAGFLLCAGFMPLMNVFDSITYNLVEATGVNASMMVKKVDFSIIRVCLSVGYCLINFAYTPIVNRFGVHVPFLCTGVLVVILLILSGTIKTFETEIVLEKGKKQKLEISRILKSYYLMTFLVLCFIQTLGASSQAFLVYLMEEVGINQALIGTAGGVRVCGEILMLLLIPLLKRKFSLVFLQAVSTFMLILQLVIFLTVREPIFIFASLILTGCGWGILLGTKAVYLRALAPEGLDTLTITLYSSVTSVGSIIMSAVCGSIVDGSGIYALYRISLSIYLIWMILFFGSWAFGKYVLKIEPIMAMFKPWRKRR
ncbi:MAG: MFS transporter [Lachnospiraceae bacterium]|nr:MFS transporter [Lachnospiraceae bacterium]